MTNYYPGADESPAPPRGTTQRLAELEATVAKLKNDLEFERRERAALPQLLLPDAAKTKKAIAELEKTLDLNILAIDGRIAEIASREPPAAGPTLSPELARAVANHVKLVLSREVWTQLDGEVAAVLVGTLRLVSQLAFALAVAPAERNDNVEKN